MRRLLKTIEEMRQAVMPEVTTPLYCLLASEVVEKGVNYARGFQGAFHPFFAFTFRPVLERTGRWRGDGMAIVVNPASIAGGYSARSSAVRRRINPLKQLEVTIHEWAHFFVEPQATEPTEKTRALHRRCVSEDLSNYAWESFAAELERERAGHGPVWIRAALHLSARAQAAGYEVADFEICDTSLYWLSNVWAYKATLKSELAQTGDRSLFEILATSPPAEFTELFESDRDVIEYRKAKRCLRN